MTMNKSVCSLWLPMLISGMLSACSLTTKTPDGTQVTVSHLPTSSSDMPNVDMTTANGTVMHFSNMGKTPDGQPSLPTMNVKGADGSVVNSDMSGKGGVEIPPIFPLKQYPGSIASYCAASPDVHYDMANMSSPDAPEKIQKFYYDDMSAGGWKFSQNASHETNKFVAAGTVMMDADKDDLMAHILLTSDAQTAKGTTIMLTIRKKTKYDLDQERFAAKSRAIREKLQHRK